MKNTQLYYHFIYRTICLITNNYYYGMHSTNNLNDGYVGSGKRLRYSIKKYGIENHVCEKLEFFESREELVKKETEIVNENLIKDPLCMNLMKGGTGGKISDYQQKKRSIAGGLASKLSRLNNPRLANERIQKISNSLKLAYIKGKRKRVAPNWKGLHHSKETKQKMREIDRTGAKNSQYGTCWITNGKDNKKIHKEDIIPNGWKLGRKI